MKTKLNIKKLNIKEVMEEHMNSDWRSNRGKTEIIIDKLNEIIDIISQV